MKLTNNKAENKLNQPKMPVLIWRILCQLTKKSQAFLYNIETKFSISMNAGPFISEAEALKVQF